MINPKPSNLVLAVGLVTGGLLIAACNSGPVEVKGKRDDLRQISAVAEKSHTEVKPNKVRECAAKDKKGKCTRWHEVTRGTKSVKVIDRRAKPAVWCVELDDVNGKRRRDDRWYEVTSTVYLKMAHKSEGDRVKFQYLTTGCSQ